MSFKRCAQSNRIKCYMVIVLTFVSQTFMDLLVGRKTWDSVSWKWVIWYPPIYILLTFRVLSSSIQSPQLSRALLIFHPTYLEGA